MLENIDIIYKEYKLSSVFINNELHALALIKIAEDQNSQNCSTQIVHPTRTIWCLKTDICENFLRGASKMMPV